jgi:hypothetical protein
MKTMKDTQHENPLNHDGCPKRVRLFVKEPPSSGSERRLVRVPWSADEDEAIRITYAYANGAFPSYRSQAAGLNRKFHDGKPVRSAASVRNREGKILSGSANAGGMARELAAQDSESTTEIDG